MDEITSSRGIIKCAMVCGSGCLACIADATMIILDATTGGIALSSGSSM